MNTLTDSDAYYYALGWSVTIIVWVIAFIINDKIKGKMHERKESESGPAYGQKILGRLPGLSTGDNRDEHHYRTKRAQKHKRNL